MNYHVLTQTTAPGAPLGMLDGALFDRFYDAATVAAVDYGAFNWYAGSGYVDGTQTFEPFPEGMVWITGDRDPAFDIRAMGSTFHIVSQKFMDVAEAAGVSFESSRRIDVLDPQGRPATSRTYHAARFHYRDRADVLDESRSRLFGEEGVLKIKHLAMREDLAEPAFRLKDLHPSYDAVFCSEAFLRCAEDRGGLTGVAFVALDTATWPGFRIV